MNETLTNASSSSNNHGANASRELVTLKDTSNDLGHSNGDELCGTSTLPDLTISTNKGDSGVPSEHSTWEVEGSDDSNETKRVPVLVNNVSGTLRWDDETSDLTTHTGGIVAHVNELLHLTETCYILE